MTERLADWTSLLTTVVVRSCGDFGWPVAAKGHPLALLPQRGQEYLGIDVMAFRDSSGDAATPRRDGRRRWRSSSLRTARRDDRVAYSLWKVLSVRATLARRHGLSPYVGAGDALPNRVALDVLPGLRQTGEASLDEVVFVMGSRSDGESFPWGYFKFWRLDHGVGRFTKLS